MAFADTTWYCNAGNQSTTGYYAVAQWATGASIAAGALRRQLAAPAVGSERVFVCVVAGTTGGSEPTWVLTRGAKTTDNTVTWQECTGSSAMNGDLTNTPNWTAMKALGAPSLGAIIKRNNGASYQICTTAGSMAASEPSFSDTAGVTTSDGTSVWTSLGAVGNFTGGQAPHARLNNVFGTSWWAAGNTIYVGDNHAESQATAITIAPSGLTNNINKVLCHNHSGSYPPAAGDLTTGASISTTGAVNINLTWNNGCIYFYGIAFKVGVGQSGGFFFLNTINSWTYFDNCSLQLANTSTSTFIQFSSNNNSCTFILNNTTVYFGHVNQHLDLQQVQFVWQNTGQVLASGSAIPNLFITASVSGQNRNVVLEALDLSQINTVLFGSSGSNCGVFSGLVKDCKLNASVAVNTAGSPFFVGEIAQIVRSDSGATAYKSSRYSYDGAETTETTVTRTGGAVDPTGQAQSRKIATTANSQWLRPFKAEPNAIWNPTTGANVTVTVYGITNDTAVPNNDDVWMEVEYLGSSATPLGTIVNTTKASVLAANAAGTADTSGWDNTATARANSHAYAIGDVIKLASNPGRVFFCTQSGTSAGSEPGGYATAVDGGSVTDGGAIFRAGCRFKLVKTLSSPQPGLAGYLEARVLAAKVSATYYVDPKPVLT